MGARKNVAGIVLVGAVAIMGCAGESEVGTTTTSTNRVTPPLASSSTEVGVGAGIKSEPPATTATRPSPWDEWVKENLPRLSAFITSSLGTANGIEDAARRGDRDELFELCFDGSSAVTVARFGLSQTPERIVTDALDGWFRGLSLGYSACMEEDYEGAIFWFDRADRDFERLTELLEDRLS